MAIEGGGFAGGLASGFGDTFASQQKIDLLRRSQEQQQQLQLSGQVNDALNNLYSTAAAIAKSAADAGQPVPASSIKALADQASELSQNAAKRGILSPDIAATVGPRIQALSGLTPAGQDIKPIVTAIDPVTGQKTIRGFTGTGLVDLPGATPQTPAPAPVAPGKSMNLSDQNITGVEVTGDNIPSPNQRVAQSFSDAGITPAVSASPAPQKPADVPIADPNTKRLIDIGLTDQKTLDFRAQMYILDPKSVIGLGRGKAGAQMVNAIQSRAAEIAQGIGIEPGAVNALRAKTHSLGQSLTQLTKNQNAIEAFEKTAEKNGDVMVQLAQKIDQTGVPVIERLTRQGRQALGDPDVAAFNTQYQLYKAEVAKILTNPNLTGILTDYAQKEIENAIKPEASYKQLVKVHNLLKQDFARRSDAINSQVDSIMGQFKLKAPAAPSPTPAQPTQPTAPVNDLQRLKEKYGLK